MTVPNGGLIQNKTEYLP